LANKENARKKQSAPGVGLSAQHIGEKELGGATAVKKRNTPAGCFIFSLLYAYARRLHIIVIKICFVFLHAHYFSDSAARQEQEAALRSGARPPPGGESASADVRLPQVCRQHSEHKGPDPGTQKT
jgi:hypothetical protein